MNESEIWKRVGYIAGRLSAVFPQYQVKTRSYEASIGPVTEFTVWDEATARYVADYTLPHAAIEDVVDVDILVDLIVARREGRW